MQCVFGIGRIILNHQRRIIAGDKHLHISIRSRVGRIVVEQFNCGEFFCLSAQRPFAIKKSDFDSTLTNATAHPTARHDVRLPTYLQYHEL